MSGGNMNIPSLPKGKCALFFDLDGTLLSHSGTILPEVRREIERVKALGHMIFINTGRSKAHLPAFIPNDPLFDGLICGSAYIEYDGEILMNKTLDKSAKEQVMNLSDKTGIPLLFEGVEKDYFYNFEENPKINLIGRDISRSDFLSDDVAITKMTFCRVITDVDTSQITALRVIKFKTYGEGIIHGCDKARAMDILLSKIGIEHSRVISFGDSENDVEMLKSSAIAVVMPHGAEGAKAVCDLVLPIDKALELIFPK